MTSKRPHWEIYNDEMLGHFDFGHALWEPTPSSHLKRAQIGDVAFIRRGRFNLLFSAGCPLGERLPGVDVPYTFKQLNIGEIDDGDPLAAGYFCTDGVRVPNGFRPASSSSPVAASTSSAPPPPSPATLESVSSVSFQLTGEKGAALLTKYPTYREDARRAGTFEKYAKEHHASWVAFARETGHGDVNPFLVTGVDRTRDFAMLCFSNNATELDCDFIISTPRTASVWGTWEKPGHIHANCGPQPRRPPSSTQIKSSGSSGDGIPETDSDEYNQCVFIRYLAVRKRLGVPRIIKAAAGPHDLETGGSDGEDSPLEARYHSGSDSDIASSPSSGDGGDDGSSFTSVDTESDVVVYNTTVDERDDFDVIADYIFQNSGAGSALLHHRDIALLRARPREMPDVQLSPQPGGSADLFTQLLQKRPQITVDKSGVGMIRHEIGIPTETWSGSVSVPTTPSIPDENEHEAIDAKAQFPRRPLSHSRKRPLDDASELAADGDDPTPKPVVLGRKYPRSSRFRTRVRLSGVGLENDCDFNGDYVERRLDTEEGGETERPFRVSPRGADIKRVAPQRPNKTKRALDLDEAHETKQTLSGGSQNSGSLRATQRMSTTQSATSPSDLRGPTRLVAVPQTYYQAPTSQCDWGESVPIDFGAIKLTDAANPAYYLQGHGVKVLDYESIEGDIICRLNFSGREIGKLRIPTRNRKNPPEPVTKKKLAFEVAKLVLDCIDRIRDEPGCGHTTFENLVLTRLIRVSKESWQPSLCWELPINHPLVQVESPGSSVRDRTPGGSEDRMWPTVQGSTAHSMDEGGPLSRSMYHPRAGSTSSSSPPLMTRRHSHQPLIGVCDQEDSWSGRRETHDIAPGIPQSTGAPHEGVSRTTMPSEGVEHTVGDSPPFLPSPIDAHGKSVRTAGRSRRSRGQPTPVNQKSNRGVYQTRDWPMDARRTKINHDQRLIDLAPSDIIKLAENLNTRDPGTSRGGRYQGDLAESPRMAQHFRSEREARGVADPAPTESLRRCPRGDNSGGYQHGFATQLPTVTPIPHDSRERIVIVQTRYRSANRQSDWIQQPSIEFGWLKLSDAANPNYMGNPALHDQAFNHEGVGGAILCRLHFGGNEIGRSKIMTVNQKSTPEPTTKKKLASEVAKLVERCIEGIRAQPGYMDVTVGNVLLKKLHHVSKNSWQPELWYETTTPGPGLNLS